MSAALVPEVDQAVVAGTLNPTLAVKHILAAFVGGVADINA